MKISITSVSRSTRGRAMQTLLMITMLGLLSSQGTASSKVRRIKFKPGATTANVTGRLNGWKDQERFVIRLRAGQTMHLSVEAKCEDCYAEIGVESPAGSNDEVDTAMCLCMVEVTKTAAGDYFITIGENRKGGKWKGSYVLTVMVQ